jgi:lanthanide-dependent methanol dehydrogenase
MKHMGRGSPQRLLLPRWLAIGSIALVAAGVLGDRPSAQGPPAAGANWTTPAGTVQGTRFSALNQINADNVQRLQEEFRFSTDVVAGHEGAPLVVNSTMYVVSPFPNFLFALDLARGGQVRWKFDPRADPFAQDKACCDIVNRGAVYAPRGATDGSVDKVIYNVLDNTTVAVNAQTGREVWRTKLGDPATGQTMTMAPLVVRNRVFVGNSGGEMGVRGFIAALDVETGKEIWRAWSTGPDTDVRINFPLAGFFQPFYAKERPPNQGVTSWPSGLFLNGGSAVWGWLTYDPVHNLLYHGTGNPGVWNPDMRPGDNKWSTTVFARDPDTGSARWAYQHTPHDAWDYDGVNESIVADLTVGGVPRNVIVRFERNGFAFTMDRLTGQILVAEKYVFANWAEAIDKVTGLPVENPAKRTREGVVVRDICPAAPGGKDQQPAAYSPQTNLFYVPTNNLCMDYEALKAVLIQGTPFVGASVVMKPGPNDQGVFVEPRERDPNDNSGSGNRNGPGPFPIPCGAVEVHCGEFMAWDAELGRKVWGIKERFPVWSGVLATAGDIVFYGTLDRWFKAVDARSGRVLFQTQLQSGIVGHPMTFLGTDGKQRVAVYSGPGGWAGAIVPAEFSQDDPFAALGAVGAMADLPRFTGPGHHVHVFKLN